LSAQWRILSLVFASLAAIATAAQAGDELAAAPEKLELHIPSDRPGKHCTQIGPSDLMSPVTVSLHRTFHDDFDEHPLRSGRWVPHYAGSVVMPEDFYTSGDASELRRKTKWNGEQQIYVDPGYEGKGTVPLGLDPFKVQDGMLSIVASRTPPELKDVLFGNPYISGILTTQQSFSQKYGYFEIRSKIPLGVGVWPAFWMVANNGGWDNTPGDLAMTTHWRLPNGIIQRCTIDFSEPNAWVNFHDYGVLWERDRLVYFIDRRPVSDIKVPASFEDPMYMIINLAMGSKVFGGVGFVDMQSPPVVDFQIDRVSAYQIDAPNEPAAPEATATR
jgi:beta-glucanase (GH16 family)